MSAVVDLHQELKTVRLYGKLGAKFGRVHRLAVETPAESIRALCALKPGFEAYVTGAKDRGIGFGVMIGKRHVPEDQLHMKACDDIRIAPVITGSKNSGIFSIIVGVVLIAASFMLPGGGLLASAFFNAGVAMALGGVVQLLSPQPKDPKSRDRPENEPNYAFNGPVNTQAQGNCVPVAYGRPWTGSAVVSAGISNGDIFANPTILPLGFAVTGGIVGVNTTIKLSDSSATFTDSVVDSLGYPYVLRHAAVSNEEMCAYGSDGYFHVSTYRGEAGTWVKYQALSDIIPPGVALVAMASGPPGEILACCGNMGFAPEVWFIKSNDSGRSWEVAAHHVGWYNITGLCYGNDVYVAASDSGKLVSETGELWGGPYGDAAFGIYFTGTHFLSSYLSAQYSVNGTAWATMAWPGGNSRAICGSDDDLWFLHITNSLYGIYKSTDKGASWDHVHVMGEWYGYQAECVGGTAIFSEGGGGSTPMLVITKDGGSSWNNNLTSQNNYEILVFGRPT